LIINYYTGIKYRKTAIGGDIFQIIEHQRKVSFSNKGINRLNKSIDWEFFRDLLEELLGYKNRDPKKGGLKWLRYCRQ